MRRRPLAAGLAALALGLLWLLGRGEGRPGVDAAGPAPAAGAPPAGHGRADPITKVEILPLPLTRQAVARVRLASGHREADASAYRYRWRVNGAETGDGGPLLPLAAFRPGDVVVVEVVAPDGAGADAALRSDPVAIANTPPAVGRITIVPAEPKASEELRVEAEGADADGDPVSFTYEWQVNGQPVDGVDGPVLEGRFVRSADRIAVIVTPADPFGQGSPRISPLVAVVNRPPEITSRPPAAADGGTYTYQLAATDPDGDALTYRLVEGPAGMRVDAASGLLEWVPQVLPEKRAVVVLQVEDGKGGRSTQQFVVQTP